MCQALGLSTVLPPTFSHVTLKVILKYWYCHYPYFTEAETEVQKDSCHLTKLVQLVGGKARLKHRQPGEVFAANYVFQVLRHFSPWHDMFLRFAFPWMNKNIGCLAVWCAVMVSVPFWVTLNDQVSEGSSFSHKDCIFWVLSLLQTVQVVVVQGNYHFEAHVSYLLLSTGKNFPYEYQSYNKKPLYFLRNVVSTVVWSGLSRSFFLGVVTVKFGSVKGFRKSLPVIFTYNQTKGNVFCKNPLDLSAETSVMCVSSVSRSAL